eukprot:359920-Chlamydomonas_euryale.AAC.7
MPSCHGVPGYRWIPPQGRGHPQAGNPPPPCVAHPHPLGAARAKSTPLPRARGTRPAAARCPPPSAAHSACRGRRAMPMQTPAARPRARRSQRLWVGRPSTRPGTWWAVGSRWCQDGRAHAQCVLPGRPSAPTFSRHGLRRHCPQRALERLTCRCLFCTHPRSLNAAAPGVADRCAADRCTAEPIVLDRCLAAPGAASRCAAHPSVADLGAANVVAADF